MSRYAESLWIDPSVVDDLVRRTKVIAFAQLPLALGRDGAVTRGIARRVDLAVRSLLDRPDPVCKLFELHAHPGAINSWGLLWDSDDAKLSTARKVPTVIWKNWSHIKNSCLTRFLCHSSAASLCNRFRHVEPSLWNGDQIERLLVRWDASALTGRLLLTSVWLDLLNRDPVVAGTWQVLDSSGADPFESFARAIYRRSDGQEVLAAVPHCDPAAVSLEEFSIWIYGLSHAAKHNGWFLELYSLKFPSCEWLDRSSHDSTSS